MQENAESRGNRYGGFCVFSGGGLLICAGVLITLFFCPLYKKSLL